MMCASPTRSTQHTIIERYSGGAGRRCHHRRSSTMLPLPAQLKIFFNVR